MNTLRFLILIGAMFLAAEAEVPTQGIDVELIADTKSIQPGQPFRLALAIHHHEGFHTYWQNPGIVGVATTIDWQLPDGFKADPIQWPVPEQVDMSGHPAHGYERDVLLMVQITPPKSLTDSTYTIAGTASWMACAVACHPGSKVLSITLPVQAKDGEESPHRDRFHAAQATLPQRLPGWTGNWQSDESGTQITVHLMPPTGEHSIKSAYFFSSDGQISSDKPQKLKLLPDGTLRLNMKRSEFSPVFRKELPGVLRMTRTNDTRLIGIIPLKLVEKSPNPTP